MDMISENVVAIAIGALAVIGVGLVVGSIMMHRSRSSQPSAHNLASNVVADPADARSGDERMLIEALIWTVESADADVAEKARRTLKKVGVEEVVVFDAPFDSDRCRIVSTVPQHDAEDGWVVSTIRPGWADGASIIRFADVAVVKND